MLAQLAGMIEAERLEVDFSRRNLGEGGLAQDSPGHVLDRILRDFVG